MAIPTTTLPFSGQGNGGNNLDNLDKDTKIQLVMNNPDTEEDTIDLGRVFHNMKVKSRIFAWVLVLCLLMGLCAPLVMYQLNPPRLTLTSVVTLRYADTLTAPDGSDLDLSTVTSSPVLQKALEGLNLSVPVTIEQLRNNMTVTRVLTEQSNRDREILSGLADLKNVQLYQRMEETELTYQNRFLVSLTNGFGVMGDDGEIKDKKDLKDNELRILMNRILDAYNAALVRQYADVRLPEDRISLIDAEEMDLPEVMDELTKSISQLLTYCGKQSAAARAYRSWQTGLSLNEWMDTIRSIKSVEVDYLDAYIYSGGLMRDKAAVALSYQYQLRTLQSDLDQVNESLEKTAGLLKEYKNNEVLVSMQESDTTRTTQMTTAYYNSLIRQQLSYYRQAAELRTQIAETQNKLDRLDSVTTRGEMAQVEEELQQTISMVKSLYDGVRTHMAELFESPLFTTYTEHSAPQGESPSFLKSSLKKMIIFGVAGAVVACGLWFLAALAPEFRRGREDDAPKANQNGKEAAEA